jgi:hypothetical protein
MNLNKIALTGLTALAGLGLGSEALADGRNPGSLLLYPEFDNTRGVATVVTVTNTNSDVTPLNDGSGLMAGDVNVHFIYVGRTGMNGYDLACQEFDRTEHLTPNDTLSVITKDHNPQQERGYLYVYAVSQSGEAIPFDHLIGNLLAVDGLYAFEYSMNPVAYRGIGDGVITDIDGDGIRDLNGVEYEQTPAEILVPRFLGQGGSFASELILIALSGGSQFTTTVDFLVYNDDEDQFSANRTFFCWERVLLTDVSTLFDNDWLKDFSGDNHYKKLGDREYGWFKMDGGVASSFSKTIQDPAIYAAYIEIVGDYAAADLPFELGLQDGHLLPRSVSGDNEE